jgi:hypothetical protein
MYGPDLEPITAVMVEDQIIVTIEELIAEQRILPGGYVVCDVFDTADDGDGEARVMRATLEAVNRQAERIDYERNAAMLYHYDAGMFNMSQEGGSIMASKPAPLSAATIIDVFEQLAHHPLYRHQLIVGIAEDFTIITMRDGTAKIVTETPA